jgi:hypothetical protein
MSASVLFSSESEKTADRDLLLSISQGGLDLGNLATQSVQRLGATSITQE